MYSELPCLPLVVDRHWNMARKLKEDIKWSELDVYMFPQTWGSTTLGFGGIGGQAFTRAYTVVVEDLDANIYSVFFGERLAYTVQNPNKLFFEHRQAGAMLPVNQAYKYDGDRTNENN